MSTYDISAYFPNILRSENLARKSECSMKVQRPSSTIGRYKTASSGEAGSHEHLSLVDVSGEKTRCSFEVRPTESMICERDKVCLIQSARASEWLAAEPSQQTGRNIQETGKYKTSTHTKYRRESNAMTDEGVGFGSLMNELGKKQ